MLVLSANKKEPEITIALPYYEKDGVMVYAEFDYITYDSAGMSTKSNLLDLENHKDTGGSYLNGFNFEQKVNADLTVTLKWINLYLEYGQNTLSRKSLSEYYLFTGGQQ